MDLIITKPYMDNINKWSKATGSQNIEIDLLFEDDFNTKSFITGVYDEDLNIIKIKILRMFSSKDEVISKEDLMVSVDLEIDYKVFSKTLLSEEAIEEEIRTFISIVKESYEVGARVGVVGV